MWALCLRHTYTGIYSQIEYYVIRMHMLYILAVKLGYCSVMALPVAWTVTVQYVDPPGSWSVQDFYFTYLIGVLRRNQEYFIYMTMLSIIVWENNWEPAETHDS